jgi:hypothetical protein
MIELLITVNIWRISLSTSSALRARFSSVGPPAGELRLHLGLDTGGVFHLPGGQDDR